MVTLSYGETLSKPQEPLFYSQTIKFIKPFLTNINQILTQKQLIMKTTKMLWYCAFAIILAASIIFSGCDKDDDDKSIPVLSTTVITEVTQSTATSGGSITNAGGAKITARGVCWSTNQTPTITDSKTEDGTGEGSFTSSISGLQPNTTYYVRAYATNSVGTGYGSALSFTTVDNRTVPVLSTSEVTEITQTTAISGGNITSDGGADVTLRGICWSTNQTPTIDDSKTENGTGTGDFTGSITNLQPSTTYYVRAYATNTIGTGYGSALSFTTADNISIPVLSTTEVTNVAPTTAISGGNITSDGGADISARGVCWSTNQTPTTDDSKTEDGTGTGSFTSSISGLQSNTTYYVRAYATNSAGTGYGDAVSFTTSEIETGTAVDVEGNVYKTVVIGNQEWFAEDLRTTKYNDGTSIPTGHSNEEWAALTTGAYTIYPYAEIDGLNSDAEVLKAYGALYNYYAVVSTSNLCPTGWHVPTDAEWTTLTDYIGVGAGIKLKSTRIYTEHPRWNYYDSSTSGTDEYGFSANPGGNRYADGSFFDLGYYAIWWSTTESDTENAWEREINYGGTIVNGYALSKNSGFSIRCLKDN